MVSESLLVDALNGFPPEFVVLTISALPFVELRGGIPLAVGLYGMAPSKAYSLSVLGNLLPIIPLLLFLGPVERELRRIGAFNSFFTWLFARTRRNMEDNVQKYGALALMLFVAVPLPATGAWTGCAAAYVFGMKLRYSLPSIAAGVIIAGILVISATLGGIAFLVD